jgi:hypothetical protein
MADKLQIVVEADISQLEIQLKKAENDLKSFQDQLSKTGDNTNFNSLNKKISETKNLIASIKARQIELTIIADTKQVEKAKTEIDSIKSKQLEIFVNADTTELNTVQSDINKIQSKAIEVIVNADTTELNTVQTDINKIQSKAVELIVNADTTELNTVQSDINKIQSKVVELIVNTDTTELNTVQSDINNIQSKAIELVVNTNTTDLDTVQTDINKIQSKAVDLIVNADTTELNKVQSDINKIQSKAVELVVNADVTELNNVQSEINSIQSKAVDLVVNADTTNLNTVQNQIDSIHTTPVEVVVNADTTELNTVQSDINKIQSKAVEVVVNADTTELNTVQSEINSIQSKAIELIVNADTTELNNVQSEINSIQSKAVEVVVNANDSELIVVQQDINKIQSKAIELVVNTDTTDLNTVQSEINKIQSKAVEVVVNTDTTQLDNVQTEINSIQSKAVEVVVNTDTTELNTIQSEINSIQSKVVEVVVNADTTNLNTVQNQIDSIHTTPVEVVVVADTTAINVVQTDINSIKTTPVELVVVADTTQINTVQNDINSIKSNPIIIPVDADTTPLVTGVNDAEAKLSNIPPVNVPISVDVRQVSAQLQLAENDLRAFTAELKNATNTEDIIKLQNSVGILKNKIGDLKSALGAADSGLKKVAGQTNSAAYAVTNLGRIVSDSAYGFIGIANNITPFIDSLASARKEAAATGSSLLSNLGKSLSGPAGLSLAFAAVTTAITFAQIGFSSWTRSSQTAKSSSDSMDESTRNLSIDIKNLGSDLNEATKQFELIKQYESIKFDIQFGSGFTKDIKLANLELTQLGYNQDIARNEFDKAKKAFSDASDALYSFTQTQKSNNIITGESGKTSNDFADALSKLGDLSNITSADLSSFNSEQKAYIQNVINASNKVNELNTKYYAYNDTISLAKLKIQALSAEEARQAAERIKNADSIGKTLAKLREDLKDQVNLGITFDVSTLKDQASLVKAAITKLIVDFNVDPKNKIIIKLQADLAELNKQILREGFKPVLLPLSFKSTGEIKLPPLKFGDSFKQAKAYLDKQAADATAYALKKSEEFQSIILTLAQDSAAQIGTLLGEGLYAAISGQTNGIAAAFQGLFSIFADAIISLGKYAIEYSTLIVGLKKALAAGSGLTGIGIGIALIALGTIIKSALAGLGGRSSFAVGTRYAPGGMALVGERGPELINLPRGSQVIPAAQTSQMMGGIGGQIEVFGMLRGQDIFFSNKKYGQTYGRTT